MVERCCDIIEWRLSAGQTRRRRQRNSLLEGVPEVQEGLYHRTHTESNKCIYICEVKMALKTKYP